MLRDSELLGLCIGWQRAGRWLCIDDFGRDLTIGVSVEAEFCEVARCSVWVVSIDFDWESSASMVVARAGLGSSAGSSVRIMCVEYCLRNPAGDLKVGLRTSDIAGPTRCSIHSPSPGSGVLLLRSDRWDG
eukprot:2016530-Rhodomonas_salina.1